MPRLPCRGFTWLELLMVLAIMASLAAIALPLLSEAIARHRLRAATTALADTFQQAREAASFRERGTAACPSANGRTCTGRTDWSVGWISLDTRTRDVLTADDALDSRVTAISVGVRTQIGFAHPMDKDPQPFNQTVALCLRGKPSTTVAIVIAKNGHSHVEPPSPEIARACGARHSRNR